VLLCLALLLEKSTIRILLKSFICAIYANIVSEFFIYLASKQARHWLSTIFIIICSSFFLKILTNILKDILEQEIYRTCLQFDTIKGKRDSYS